MLEQPLRLGWAVHCPRRDPNAGLGRRVVIGGIAVLRCTPWRLRAPAEDAAHRAGGTDDAAGLLATIFRPTPKPLSDAAALIAHCEAEAAAVLELFGSAAGCAARQGEAPALAGD